ncbi:glycoside hydrolase family 108 protein [Rhizobium phaseoli]|uniref:glycoside hydrolase family 108 protein n=1 Tax=Rhizobium phaseoli TaxID=396 RepID=UPI0025556B4C|nr:glycoside hydrolase family 108 protein [Rhizobium phaseoli]MDK4729350.1 glycoside hydrolase family 108 protein [Rhizobium phaseoli]
MDQFIRSLEKVLREEGGYSDHPDDPGGPTMKGVTQRVYDAYRDRIRKQRRSVRLIETSELEEIYRTSYWDLIRGGALPAGVNYVVFDGAVNSGVKRSVEWLQAALGVNVDGVIGPATIAAAQRDANNDALIDRILDRRLAFLQSLRTWKKFGKGWKARVARVRAVGQAWATGVEAPALLYAADPVSAKALDSDVKTAPSAAPADATTGGGIGFGGVAFVLKDLQDQLAPYSMGSDLIGKAVVGLIVVSGALTVGGLLWGLYARHKAAKIKQATVLS